MARDEGPLRMHLTAGESGENAWRSGLKNG
jgi:hypothetical protein